MISEELLALIICPVCGGSLEPLHEHELLLCKGCGNRFPVEHGIPVLIASHALREPGTEDAPDAR